MTKTPHDRLVEFLGLCGASVGSNHDVGGSQYSSVLVQYSTAPSALSRDDQRQHSSICGITSKQDTYRTSLCTMQHS